MKNIVDAQPHSNMVYKKEKLHKKIISPYHNQLKPMSVKLIELVSSIEALNKLSETKLPASVGFSLGKFLKEVTPEIETYNKVRSEKIVEYGTETGETDEKGNKKYSFSDVGSTELNENGKKYVAEMTEMENKELEVKIPEIKITDLGNVVIEPRYLVVLSWLIKE